MEFFKTYSFRRKLVHLIMGIMFVILINVGIGKDIQLILVFGLICALLLSIYTKYWKPKLIVSILSLFDKPKDMETFPAKGAIYYLIGVMIALALFDIRIASASIMILALGDPAAHIIGRYYGKTHLAVNRKKLLEGTLAGTLFGTMGALFFVPIPIAFFGAAFGMIAEAVELEFLNLDDNFFIPFVSGTVMWLIMSLLP